MTVQLLTDEAMMSIVSARNDSEMFGELVQRWEHRIAQLCLRLTGNRHDAEDAVQDTFSRIFAGRHQFRGDSRFSTWMWTIAVRAAHDVRRRTRSAAVDSECLISGLQDPTGEPAEILMHAEQSQRVSQAVQRLPEDLQTIVVLKHYQKLKFREIADVLGIPIGTVCSRLTEALNRLQAML